MKDIDNGATISGTVSSNGKPPPLPRAYYMSPDMSPNERERLAMGGLDPDDYVVVLCPSATPPQMSQPVQGVQVFDPETNANGGIGYVFLIPVILPINIPNVASGVVGPDGKPAGQIRFEGPPTAICRVLLPRKTLTQEAQTEYDAVCSLAYAGAQDDDKQ